MSPLREAVVLPALFLTVALAGGFRVDDAVRLTPPSLTALVLAVVLLGVLAKGGVLAPGLLLNGHRTPLENVSGGVVLLTLLAASAQAINLLIPDAGLLHAAFAILFFCQLLVMGAAGAARAGLLRSLLVLLGSLFVLRHIVVEALYGPERGLLHAMLTTLMSGVTLGGAFYEPHHPLTGYVGFCTLVLYVIGLVLLPAPSSSGLVRGGGVERAGLPTTVALALAAVLTACGTAPSEDQVTQPARAAPEGAAAAEPAATGDLVTPAQRAAALRRAQIWREPSSPIGAANLRINPAGPGSFRNDDIVRCRLKLKGMSGTTPKFDCELAAGDTIRVKYGRGNPELYSEVATTRLLSTLGFGADRVYVVAGVECAGCSRYPFHALRCLSEERDEQKCFPFGVNYSTRTAFADVVIERRLEGRRIEASPDQGWAWYELDQVDEAAGGAPRSHVDALKLLAIFIAHWDNKGANQRLVCLPGSDQPDGGCLRPLAMIQDVGASFGPVKLDLQNWRATPVWTDARACRVSMEQLPWGGGTFPSQAVSEGGRLFLLRLLEQLSASQIEDLFAGARVAESEGITAEGRQPAAWAAAFADKVRQIREAGPCPAPPPTGS